jgi:hypothetical protein
VQGGVLPCRADCIAPDDRPARQFGLTYIDEPAGADLENGRRTLSPGNLVAIRAALKAAGVIFIDENGEGPGVRLRKKHGL